MYRILILLFISTVAIGQQIKVDLSQIDKSGSAAFDDSTSQELKITFCGFGGTGTWSTGGALNTGRYYLAGAGTQNEGLAFGGYTNVNLSCTEEYNKPQSILSCPLI